MLSFTNEFQNDIPALVVDGEIDISSHGSFRQALQALDFHAPQVLVDFCRCGYFDSSALNELVAFFRTRNPAQDVMLAVPHEYARRIFSITNLDRLFAFVDCAHVI